MKIQIASFLLICSFFSYASALDHVDVEANLPSGVYRAPISIELTPTDSSAKTFYSFNPDGGPQDAFLYTGALLFKKSTPFVFFSVISPTNESKIKINTYTIEYPSTVRFRDPTITISSENTVSVSLVNDASDPVDLSYWQIQSEAFIQEIPAGTMLATGATYDAKITYAGSSSITLRSPDGEEKWILQIVRDAPKASEVPVPVHRVVSRSTPPLGHPSRGEESAPDLSTESVSTPDPSRGELKSEPFPSWGVVADRGGDQSSEVIPESVKTPPVVESISTPNPSRGELSGINADALKTSVSDSGNNNLNPLYIFGILAFLVLLGAVQFVVKRKKA